jgi:hypothetical protein
MGLFLTNVLGFSSSVYFEHIMCYWKIFLYTTQKSYVSTDFAKQIMPFLRILCYKGSLVIWTVISLTTPKFTPLIFSISGVTLTYTANMFILMILYKLCLSPTKFCYIIVHIRKVETLCNSRTSMHLGKFPVMRRTLFWRCLPQISRGDNKSLLIWSVPYAGVV